MSSPATPRPTYHLAGVMRLIEAKRKVLARLDAQQLAQHLFEALNSLKTALTAPTASTMAQNLDIMVAGYGSTFQQMCDTIVAANFLTRKDTGLPPTAEEIFNYSPDGELFMIPYFYGFALQILAERGEKPPHEQ